MSSRATRPAVSTKRSLGSDVQREVRAARRQQFLELYDFSRGRGLEIGPLDAGVADEEVDDVRYVDVFDQEGIRDHYKDDPNVVLELVPEIHFPLYVDGEPRTLAEAAAPGGPYDWIIASHVIEHVPDVIGWLQQLAEVSADDARLLLAVPDRRYCFDLHRPPTTVGQALEAYEEQHTRPSVRAVFDFFSSVVSVDTAGLWRHERPAGRGARIHDLAYTLKKVELARSGEYVDCHVWTFTPQSLLEQVQALRRLGLCQWYVERLQPLPGSVEFLAVLRRLPRGADPTADVPGEVELSGDLPDWLDDEWAARVKIQELEEKVHELRLKIRDRGTRVRTLRQRVQVLRTRNRALQARVAQLEGSVRLRVGSAVVSPVVAVRRRLRRR